VVPIREGAVTTSGDYERFMTVDGRRYSHLLDPRTGWPVRGPSSVTVVAPRCIIAGSATTIAMLMGDDGGAWLDELGLPSLRVDEDGKLSGPLARERVRRDRRRAPGLNRPASSAR